MTDPLPLNRRSAHITQGKARAPNRSMFYGMGYHCLLYTSPSPRDKRQSRMPSSA